MLTLGPRLAAIAGYLPPGQPFADVGTDHGYLPCALVRENIVPCAIASDRLRRPLEVASRNARRFGVEDRIDLRLGDGLSVLRPDEVETAVLAGMGANQIRRIITSRGRNILSRVIVSPNTGWTELRRWIAGEKLNLVDEQIVEESGRFYVVMHLDLARKTEVSYCERDLLLGPLLRRKAGPAYLRWCRMQHERGQKLLCGTSRSAGPHGNRGLGKRMMMLEEALATREAP